MEVALVLGIVAVLFTILVGARPALDRFALTRAARIAEAQLVTARTRAVALQTDVHVLVQAGHLEVRQASGARLRRVDLTRIAMGRLDSIRLRPARLRFNARGHAGPGSLYLYRGRRGVRLVVNFVGRVRLAPFRN